MIGHIKSIKMSGLSKHLSTTIATLRAQEITASKPFRVVGAVTSSVAQIPLLLSPVLAFVMFQGITAATGQVLDATRMFAAFSLITLLAQPLFWVLEVLLDLSAAFGAFGRIQAFLVKATREEYRTLRGANGLGPSATREEDAGLIELQTLRPLASRSASHNLANTYTIAIDVEDATFAWSPERQILSNISFSLSRGQFALLIGPVASGKTTLLKGLLGEVPHSSGRVFLASSRLSWCEQSPWILVSGDVSSAMGSQHSMLRLLLRTNPFVTTSSGTLISTRTCTIKQSKRVSLKKTLGSFLKATLLSLAAKALLSAVARSSVL